MILPTIAPDKWVELQAKISDEWLDDSVNCTTSSAVHTEIWTKDMNGDEVYTDQAQESFNSIYDKVDDILHMFFIKGDN